jgi:hypothetical protein
VANTETGQDESATSLQPIMAYLPINTTNEMMIMMRMMAKIKLIIYFKCLSTKSEQCIERVN